MLRKLGSPSKGSRFAASATQEKDAPKELSSAAGGSRPAFEMSAGTKSPPTTPSKKRLSLWNRKTPAAAEVPTVDPPLVVGEGSANETTQPKPANSAEATAVGSLQEPPGEMKATGKPAPLKRSPRQRSNLNVEAESKSRAVGSARELPDETKASATATGKPPPLKRSPRQRSNLNVEAESKSRAVGSARELPDETKASATATGKPPPLKRSPRQRSNLNVEADSKAVGSTQGPSNGEMNSKTITGNPAPLKRTPRRRSILEEEADAKPSSPKTGRKEEKKTKHRGKRDSLGLKSLMTKRGNSTRDEKPEVPGPESPLPQSQSDTSGIARTRDAGRSPTKKKSSGDTMDPPALSPIRRKPRQQPHEGLETQNATTETIREAASLLSRNTGVRNAGGLPPMHQPEVHIIGEIIGGEGFGNTKDGYCCKWSVDYGNQWIHVAGDQIGQTQIDYSGSLAPEEGTMVWAHPIDLHFATTALQGWPKMLLQVWRVDSHMQMNVVGYGFVHLPFAPGHHRLTVAMWRPMGTLKEEVGAALVGHTPELLTDEVLFNTAWSERCRLKTIATGRVHVSVDIILRNFDGEGATCIDM